MKRKMVVLMAAAMFSGSAAFAAGKIVCEGSTTVLPIAQKAAETFMDKNQDADITVRGGGSGVGITSLIEKRCDIADASRPMKDAELQKAASNGVDAKAHVIAMDGIAVIVHSSNKVTALTKEQVKGIYTGTIVNWSSLGGANEKIVVVSRDTASGTYEAFGELALGGAKPRPDALLQASNQAVVGVVAKATGGIGYAGIGYVAGGVKAVSINGVSPSKQTVLSRTYPYSRPLYMYTNGEPKGAAKDFIGFIISPEGQKLVEEEGFVGLK